MVRNAAINPGYMGHPARIFYEMTAYGRPGLTLIDNKTILEKWYSHLRAHLPVIYDATDEKRKEYSDKIEPMLNDAAREIQAMDEQYKEVFEGEGMSQPEKDFRRTMRGVFERLDLITARAGIIDKIQQPTETVMF